MWKESEREQECLLAIPFSLYMYILSRWMDCLSKFRLSALIYHHFAILPSSIQSKRSETKSLYICILRIFSHEI